MKHFPLARGRIAALALAGVAAAGFVGFAAFAEPALAPPPWPTPDSGQATLAADPVRPLMLGTVRVVAGASKLADVRQAVGAGEVVRRGDGAQATGLLCYTVLDARPAQRVWLTASPAAGGERIDGIAAAELGTDARATPACPELPAHARPARFDDGLWLGRITPERRQALGMPARGAGAFAIHYRDAASTLGLELRKSHAVELHVARALQG